MVSGVVHDPGDQSCPWRPAHDLSVRNGLEEFFVGSRTDHLDGVGESAAQPVCGLFERGNSFCLENEGVEVHVPPVAKGPVDEPVDGVRRVPDVPGDGVQLRTRGEPGICGLEDGQRGFQELECGLKFLDQPIGG